MIRLLSAVALCTTLMFSAPAVLAQDDAEYIMTKEEVLHIQTILFERGVETSHIPDGKMGPKTRAAITKYLTVVKEPITRYFTKRSFDETIAAGFLSEPMMWGAVSTSTDDVFEVVTKYTSGIAALKFVLQQCQKKSKYPKECITGTVNQDGTKPRWLMIVSCKRAHNRGNVIAAGQHSAEEAKEKAYLISKKAGFERTHCKVVALTTTDGSHKKIDGASTE